MTTHKERKTAVSVIGQGYVSLPLACPYAEKRYSSYPNLVLLNANILEMDGCGCEVCRRIRDMSDMPVLIINADGQKSGQLKGSSSCVDNHITKSVDFQDLLPREQGVLRRTGDATQGNGSSAFHNNGIEVKWRNHQVWVRGHRVKLSPIEFKILACLIENRGYIVSHEQLLEEGWGVDHNGNKSFVKVYMNYLRQKIEEDPSNPQLILTERGAGYRFSVQNKQSLGERLDQVTIRGFPTNHDMPDKPRDLAESATVK